MKHSPKLSPLKQAYDICLDAAQEGFDWDSPLQAALKVREELEEVIEELKKNDSPSRQQALIEELGDLYLACGCLARQCAIEPEDAILLGIEKFKGRYARLKSYAKEKNISLSHATRSELIALWQKAKEA